MSILVCTTAYGGCGFVGHNSEFRGDGNFCFCPECGEDHTFELTTDNLERFTNDKNRELARKLITNDESVLAIVECGCVHHAEDHVACRHDVAHARTLYYDGQLGNSAGQQKDDADLPDGHWDERISGI